MESVLCTEQKLISKMSIVNTANARDPYQIKQHMLIAVFIEFSI